MATKKRQQPNESGFVLLVTLILVGVVISIGLSILDLSIKQVRLSTTAKDSELAFHAANAGMECAQFWRREEATAMEAGNDINPSCFETSAGTISANSGQTPTLSGGSDGTADFYEYEFSWGTAPDERCTQASTLVVVSDLPGSGTTVTNMLDMVPGYPDGNNLDCEQGSICTVLSVRGYNKPCSNINEIGIVQREVLLQF